MLQILCKTPAAIFKIQIPTDTKSKFNTLEQLQEEASPKPPYAIHGPLVANEIWGFYFLLEDLKLIFFLSF